MISMNCIPPRAIAVSSAARFPAVNARMRNSDSWNIGDGTLVSITQNPASSAIPAPSPPSTRGLPQPVAAPP